MQYSDSIFRKNDIRGVLNKDFDTHFTYTLGKAFATFIFNKLSLKNQKKPVCVAVGYDSRLSSPKLATDLAQGLRASGVEVKFLGLCSTPCLFFAHYYYSNPRCLNIQASVMVTASHNPACFNGFKFAFNKETLSGVQILQLKKIIQKKSFVKSLKNKKPIVPLNVTKAYSDFMKNQFADLHNTRWKKDRVVIDCGNGSGGRIAQTVFKALNLKAFWLYAKPDGNFPHHHPDPGIEDNLRVLQKKVLQKKAVCGIALDGDADRLVVVDHKGRILYGDELMSIFISHLTHKNVAHQKPVVTADVKCAPWFYDFLKKHKFQPVMGKSGHSLIRKKTLQTKSVFGGELSGHLFFCDEGYLLDDGLYGILRLMRILKKPGSQIADLLKKTLPKNKEVHTFEIQKPIVSPRQATKGLKRLKNYYQAQHNVCVDLVDGVRVRLASGAWGLARVSNTQSIFTLRFGATNKKALLQIKEKFYHLLFLV